MTTAGGKTTMNKPNKAQTKMKNETRHSSHPSNFPTDPEALRDFLMEIAKQHAQEQIDYFNELFAEINQTNGLHQNK